MYMPFVQNVLCIEESSRIKTYKDLQANIQKSLTRVFQWMKRLNGKQQIKMETTNFGNAVQELFGKKYFA